MSIPKEKLIIQEIKAIIDRTGNDGISYSDSEAFCKIADIVNNYSDSGYVTGPIVGISEGPENDL